ncbi:MAG: hypothetical protein AUI13_06655 [Gemmatimonadetes bacterium 13_2_20CM_2_69_23]|nr:MAG: hypothetical protein AUI13_06655 [Gemmatimonadetes bacterium 13_2_20CM_2_69_23]
MATLNARHPFGACLLGATLVACHARVSEDEFRATRVPVARLDSVLRAADSVRLPLADARLLLEVAPDIGLASMPPHDTMTIAEILSWARAEHARKQRAAAETTAAAAARRREIQQQLDSLVAVMVVDKSFLPKNPDLERYQDFISLTFAYRNRGTKSIQAFQGDVSFLDATGDTIYSAHLKVDGPIAPGKTRREPGRIIRYDPFRPGHQRLRSTPLDKLKVVWQPSDAVFADGSRLTLAGSEP